MVDLQNVKSRIEQNSTNKYDNEWGKVQSFRLFAEITLPILVDEIEHLREDLKEMYAECTRIRNLQIQEKF